MNPRQADVSVLIATRDRAGPLQATLDSLSRVEVSDGLAVDVVLVDNGSRDDTSEVMRRFSPPHFRVRVLGEETPGKAVALNAGLRRIESEVVLFTDDDVRLPLDWIHQMATPVLRGDADAIAGGVTIPHHLLRPWMTPVHRSLLASTEMIDPESPSRLVGANMSIRRSCIESVGYFDEELGPGKLGLAEETLLTRQLYKQGYSVTTNFDCVVEHHFDESRLRRDSQLGIARRIGASEGYIAHHWHHGSSKWLTLAARAHWSSMKLSWLRWRLRKRSTDADGLSLEELELVRYLSRLRQRMLERRRVRKY